MNFVVLHKFAHFDKIFHGKRHNLFILTNVYWHESIEICQPINLKNT